MNSDIIIDYKGVVDRISYNSTACGHKLYIRNLENDDLDMYTPVKVVYVKEGQVLHKGDALGSMDSCGYSVCPGDHE